MNKETQKKLYPIIADHLFGDNQARRDAVALHLFDGLSYYAAEKQTGHAPNTLGRYANKVKKEFEYLSRITKANQ